VAENILKGTNQVQGIEAVIGYARETYTLLQNARSFLL
jgi:hypothetical protein